MFPERTHATWLQKQKTGWSPPAALQASWFAQDSLPGLGGTWLCWCADPCPGNYGANAKSAVGNHFSTVAGPRDFHAQKEQPALPMYRRAAGSGLPSLCYFLLSVLPGRRKAWHGHAQWVNMMYIFLYWILKGNTREQAGNRTQSTFTSIIILS